MEMAENLRWVLQSRHLQTQHKYPDVSHKEKPYLFNGLAANAQFDQTQRAMILACNMTLHIVEGVLS